MNKSIEMALRAGGQQVLAEACLLAMVLCLTSGANAQQAPPFASLKEIRERGVVMQKWETSCAAASIATVLTYGFNDPVSEPYAAARMLEKTDPAKVKYRGGFSLLDMKNFVDERGYTGSAYKDLSFDDLRVFHAAIVPLDVLGFKHYVVFNGAAGGVVFLADPAFGNHSMSEDKFKTLWMDGMAFVVTR